MAAYEIELSSQRRELHARYERKYDDFRRKELLEAVERKAIYSRKLSAPSVEPTTDHTLNRSAGPSPSNTHRETGPRADPVAVSNPETQNPPERAQLAHPKVIPSSAEPEPVPAPRALETSPPSVAHGFQPACKLTSAGFKTLKSISETGLPISRPPPHPSVHVKLLEQSNTTVLRREFPRGNSLMGTKPSTRVVSAPTSPKRGCIRLPEKRPVKKVVEVSSGKRTSATKHSTIPKAAPTLLKSSPVSCIQALPPVSSLPSSRGISTRRTSNAISTHQVVSETTHGKSKTPLRVISAPSSPVPSVKGQVFPSSRVVPMLCMPKDVKTRQVVMKSTHPMIETRLRVSLKVAIPRSGEIPSAGCLEHSAVVVGPAVKPALSPFSSSEIGEGLRASETAVSIQNVEVNEDGHSPSSETARKWSRLSSTPATVDGGGQLARAATYIRERSSRRSLAFDEFVRRTPKAPPDKITESANLRHLQNVVSEKEKASISIGLPEPMAENLHAASSHSQPETPRASERSMEFLDLSIPTYAGPTGDTSNVEVTLSPKVTSTRRVLKIVNARRVVSLSTHQGDETLTRVSLKALAPRFGVIPSADGILVEHSECSSAIIGPAIEQALASLSAEVEERRRISNAIVSVHNGKKECAHTPSHSAVFTLPESAPTTPSVPPTLAMPQLLPLVDLMPPLVMSRRHELSVVSKIVETSNVCSQGPEIARKQSRSSSTSIGGEESGLVMPRPRSMLFDFFDFAA